jgi:hypothetical protein
MLGLLVGTAMVWGLTALVVAPLARLLGRKVAIEAAGADSMVDAMGSEEGVPTAAFIAAHVLVLGIAGLVLGWTTGSWLVGVAFKRSSWPGLISLMAASALGCCLHG